LLIEKSNWLLPDWRTEKNLVWFRDEECIVDQTVQLVVIPLDEINDHLVVYHLGMVSMYRYTSAAQSVQHGCRLVYRSRKQLVGYVSSCGSPCHIDNGSSTRKLLRNALANASTTTCDQGD